MGGRERSSKLASGEILRVFQTFAFDWRAGKVNRFQAFRACSTFFSALKDSTKAKLLEEPVDDRTISITNFCSASWTQLWWKHHISRLQAVLLRKRTIHYREPALNFQHAPATHSTNFPGADKTFLSCLWKFISWFHRRLRTELLPTPAVGCPLNFQ